MPMQPDRNQTLRGEDFPATKFLCDVARMGMGKMSKDEIRQRWAAGEYRGVCPKWAAWNMGAK